MIPPPFPPVAMQTKWKASLVGWWRPEGPPPGPCSRKVQGPKSALVPKEGVNESCCSKCDNDMGLRSPLQLPSVNLDTEAPSFRGGVGFCGRLSMWYVSSLPLRKCTWMCTCEPVHWSPSVIPVMVNSACQYVLTW